MGLMDPNGPFPLSFKYSQKFPKIFVRKLSYSLLNIHRKLTSGYLLCDKATLSVLRAYWELSKDMSFFSLVCVIQSPLKLKLFPNLKFLFYMR